MLPLYRSLLYLYPVPYRYEYGEEMMAVLSEVHAEIGNKSVLLRMLFGTHEVGGLLYGAFQEHLRSITGRSAMFSPRRFKMHSEFRFPKATVTLMTIILVAILVAIDRAKAIQASIPYANPQVGAIKAAEFAALPTLLIALLGACVAGVVGWAILFALRRSGIHRLSEIGPSSGRSSSSRLRS